MLISCHFLWNILSLLLCGASESIFYPLSCYISDLLSVYLLLKLFHSLAQIFGLLPIMAPHTFLSSPPVSGTRTFGPWPSLGKIATSCWEKVLLMWPQSPQTLHSVTYSHTKCFYACRNQEVLLPFPTVKIAVHLNLNSRKSQLLCSVPALTQSTVFNIFITINHNLCPISFDLEESQQVGPPASPDSANKHYRGISPHPPTPSPMCFHFFFVIRL